MAQILDDVSYLSQEIGPRPAGTEEEQQAALYIADKLKKDAGFDAKVEDFKCVPDYSILTIGFFGLAFVAALVAFLVNVAAIPAVIVGLIAAVLYGLELADRPVISRFLRNGISQNVVAKYEPHVPGDVSNRRRRKIVLVARYDSGRSMPLMRSPFVNVLPILKKGSRVSMVAVPVLLLIRHLAFAHSAGVGALLLNVLIIVGMVFILAALGWNVFYRLQQYNDAANSNASGVAVMLEVARRIGAGAVASDSVADGENAVVHGERAAREEGLVPEGADISYTTDVTAGTDGLENVEDAPQKEAERLAAAKAAIAALTGASVNIAAPVSDISDNLVKVEPEPVQETEELRHEQNLEILNAFAGGPQASEKKSEQESAQEGETPSANIEDEQPEPQIEAKAEIPAQEAVVVPRPVAQNTNISSNNDQNVPDWYKKAQQRAKRQPQTEPETSFRSRYAAALDATEEKLHEQDMQQEELARQEVARQEEERQKRLIQEQMANLARQRAQEAAKQNEPVKENIPAETSAPSVQQTVSRETRKPVEDSPKASADYARMDVSRETTESSTETSRGVSRETSANDVEVAAPSRSQHNDDFAAAPADSTMMMPPIDVSDLLAEMKDYKTAEPDVPAFITGEHEKINVAPVSESVSETAAAKNADSKPVAEPADEESSRLIDPNAPFVPVPTDRTLKMSVEELSGGSVEAAHNRAHISLPDLPKPEVTPINEVTKQRAPLADVTDNKAKEAARSLLSTVLPEVGTPEEAKAAKREAAMAHLSELPSLSGELRTIQAAEEATTPHEHNTVSATGSFATVGATGSFTAVGDELVADVAPDELYIEDADDSDYEENFTETGAFAGPGYVEMPKSRMQKLLGKFGFGRKKKHDEKVSTHEWLQVDEDFEARSVGKQRGSWESFQHEDAQGNYADAYEQNHTGDTGAFEMSDEAYDGAYAEGYADGSDYYADDAYAGDAYEDNESTPLPANSPMRRANTFKNVQLENEHGAFDDDTKRWNGGAVSSDRVDVDATAADKKPASISEDGVSEEIEQIYQFRNPDIDMDVWFVALGASVSSNEGIRELISLHEPELKRAIVINLESLGDGELMFVNKEGSLKTRTATSRMKRCIKKATQETGVSCGTREIAWRESPATVAMARKLQGMTLAGMDGAKPAGFADADDVVEKVSEKRLQESAGFVLSMLKNI